ncbi:lachesin [Tetranychus urticae]|uniref:lachesin n=1 Tax=Tetranychus urticae TaxID=32264 RepID=UPI00077B8BC5|nr:lachesin [Tetranychus urticae]
MSFFKATKVNFAFFCLLFINFTNLIGTTLHPAISFISHEKVVMVGDTVDLQCAIQYPKDYPVIWAKIDHQDPRNFLFISKNAGLSIPDNRYSIRHDDASYTYTLQLSKIRETDSGTYQCQVITGTTSRVTAEVNVTVRVPPTIIDNSTRVVTTSEGATIELECYATGHPKPMISWRRENNEILPTGSAVYFGNILSIHNITKEDRGTYYCIANNSVGTEAKRNVGVRVVFSPQISAPIDTYRQAFGYTVELECISEGYPAVDVYWLKDHYRLNDASNVEISTVKTTSEVISSTLRIGSLKPEDLGNYVCQATNKHGSASKTIRVEESPTPVYSHAYLPLASSSANIKVSFILAVLLALIAVESRLDSF